MTPAELRRIATEYGRQRLADALGWTVRTLDRKIAGQHRITKADAIAIRAVIARSSAS
jgi:plasmid maintenance system antidote protein VapI